jgi:protocatechuate 3,4-dioxygenase beta subunit
MPDREPGERRVQLSQSVRRSTSAGFPPALHEAYRSTVLRAPRQPLVQLPAEYDEFRGVGPRLADLGPGDADLTRNAGTGGEAIGERIIVTGRVLDEHDQPVPGTPVEIWQANAAGRYAHDADDHPAPLDPNFLGVGRCLTTADGSYRFTTIRPGPYPWKNHPNAWRPAHIHFSVFGPWATQRLVTQMYFPGDPLHAYDPILHAVPEEGRPRLIARYDHAVTEEAWALGFRFDIVLAGAAATPPDPDHD